MVSAWLFFVYIVMGSGLQRSESGVTSRKRLSYVALPLLKDLAPLLFFVNRKEGLEV